MGSRDQTKRLMQGSVEQAPDADPSHDKSQKPTTHHHFHEQSSIATQPESDSKVRQMGRSLDHQFIEATFINKVGRNTLYTTAITNSQKYRKYEKKLGPIKHISSIFGGGFSTEDADNTGKQGPQLH